MIGAESIVEMRYLARQGLKVTDIARRLNRDPKTVRKYLNQDPDAEQPVDTARASILDPYRPYLRHRLAQWPELTASRLYREISQPPNPGIEGCHLLPPELFDGSERTVRRFVREIRPHPPRVYQPLETLPGEQAQVDWGHCGFIDVAGERKRLYCFSFVLSYSRLRYVEFTTSQDIVTFLSCLQRALEYIGGVPCTILFDNAKTVVIERVGSVIRFNQDLLRLAMAYRFRPDACWLHDPESKGKVENSIQFVKRDFLYARTSRELQALNREAWQWCDEVANDREHQATREVPASRLAEEQQALSPLPAVPIPVFQQVQRVVHKDATFRFETNQYSVPHTHARSRVTVHVHADRLEVHAGTERIAVHRRCPDRGQLILDEGHYRDRPRGPRKRRSALQARFEALGPVAPDYLRGLARQRGSGHLKEQVEQILSLAETHGAGTVHAALDRAHHFGRYNYSTVKRIVERELSDTPLPADPRAEAIQTPYQGLAITVEQRSVDDYARLLEVSDT